MIFLPFVLAAEKAGIRKAETYTAEERRAMWMIGVIQRRHGRVPTTCDHRFG